MAQLTRQTTDEVRTEPEITAPVRLCDGRGRLNAEAAAWSRTPLHRCNLRGHFLRKKRWNYWAVMSDRYIFSATIADVDYLALGAAYLIELETGRSMEKTISVPFGGQPMPQTVYEDVRFKHKKLRVTLGDDGARARIRAKARSFSGGPLLADIAIERPADHETLNVVIPWSRDRFQFTSKQNTLPASGFVEVGGERFEFEPGKSFAVLDYGRGVWKYNTFWNWGAASGVQGAHTIGLNLGGGWTDGTGMTENGICLDGRLHKVHEDLAFHYNPRDFMQPWEVRTVGSDRIDLRFEPIFERAARTDLLVLKSDVHQVFGHYHGTLVSDEGEAIPVSRLPGWVEQQDARW